MFALQIGKLLQMKEEQAKEMNTVNDMYSSLLKAAKNNSEMIKAVEDRKRMGDQLSDSSHILDTVAYAARRMPLWLRFHFRPLMPVLLVRAVGRATSTSPFRRSDGWLW